MAVTKTLKIEIPVPVREILDTLKAAGFEAYIVGGCVRDALLGRIPEDWDITTSALPSEVKSLFRATVDTGIQHGTVMVLQGGTGYEVTTYRVDGEYLDARHPSSVTFTRSLEEDLKRRDFTINAFAWDEDGLIDLFDGLCDLQQKVIRCVGDPKQRFHEDALRIMRAIRFSAQLGFSIEPETAAQIRAFAENLGNISMERIRVEWEKTLLSPHPCMVNLYADFQLAPYIVPQFYPKCFDHTKEDLLQKICGQMRREEDRVRFVAGSVTLDAAGQSGYREIYRRLMMTAFFENLTPDEAEQAFRYLRYDNETRKAVADILRYKDTKIPYERTSVKQCLNQMGPETFFCVLAFQKISGTEQQADRILKLAEDIMESGEPWNLSQLAVNGSDLIRAGIPQGEKVGKYLKLILQKVMQSPTLNSKEQLCSEEFLMEVEYEFKRSL